MTVDDQRQPYVQVADALRSRISAGDYPPGARIPSLRELAKSFGVAEMTVSNGLRLLREEGLIVSTPGRGTFVREDAKVAPAAASLEGLAAQVQALTARVAELERRLEGQR